MIPRNAIERRSRVRLGHTPGPVQLAGDGQTFRPGLVPEQDDGSLHKRVLRDGDASNELQTRLPIRLGQQANERPRP